MIDDYTPAPPRILCANGAWSPDAPPELRAKHAEPSVFVEPPKPTLLPSNVGQRVGRDPIEQAKKRKPIGEWSRAAANKSWNRKTVDINKILALKAKKMTHEQIGKKLGCSRYTVASRIDEWMKEKHGTARR